MNRYNSSYKDYQRSDTYTNEEYNRELESYLYANIYYTHNEQDRWVNTNYSSDDIYTATNYDSVSRRHTANNFSPGQSSYNRSKRYPPRSRGISHHLSQQDIPTDNHAESNMNIPFRNEVYYNNDLNRKKQANDLSPNFNSKHQNNKSSLKSKGTPQHIRFAEEDLQNLSNDLLTIETQNVQQNCENNVFGAEGNPSTMLQSVLPGGNNSEASTTMQSSNTNDKRAKTNNICKKYEFSKKCIKNLYVQKYKELEKRYQKKKHKNKDSLAVKDLTDEDETHSKYNVMQKSKKKGLHTTGQFEHSEELAADSDTDESILEVPIPPKPQPPLISLNDSDEDTSLPNRAEDHENDIQKSTFINECSELDFLNTSEEAGRNSYYENYSTSANSTEYHSNMTLTRAPDVANIVQTEVSAEDIVLNCTRIQKCASSVIEIRNTCRAAQQLQEENNFDENVANSQIVGEGEVERNSNLETVTEMICNTDNNELVEISSIENTSSNEIHTGSTSQVALLQQKKQKAKKRSNETPAQKKDNKRKKNNDEDDSVIIIESNVNSSRTGNKKDKWEQYFFKPMTQEMKKYYNESSMEGSVDIRDVRNKMSKDPRLWGILDKDLMPSPSKRSKFGRCNHCHQDGHTRINCPEPRRPPLCYMCGTKGHTETRCPQKMCLTCGKKQSTYRKTCDSCRKYRCTRCKATGHIATSCPDLWRKYHHTTTNSTAKVPDNPMNIMKPKHLLYCCNCTRQGHDSSTCNTYRWSPHYPTPVHVSNYVESPQQYERHAQATNANNTQEDLVPIASYSQYTETGQKYTTVCKYGPNNVINGNLRQNVSKRICYLNGVIEGQVFPHFLDYLSKHVDFNVEFRLYKAGSFEICCRGEKCYLRFIMNLIKLWLSMEDDEKNSWVISELPFSKKKILNVLNQKFDELNNDLLSDEDPKRLRKKIESLKKDLKKMENDQSQHNTYCKIKNNVLNLQKKLFIILRNKPEWSKSCNKLYEQKDTLEKKSTITIMEYLDILCNYHSTFTPHTPRKIDRMIYAYYKRIKKKLMMARRVEESKSNSRSEGNVTAIEENTTLTEQNQSCESSVIITTLTIEPSTSESEPLKNIQSNDDLGKTLEDPCTVNNDNCKLSQIPCDSPSAGLSNDTDPDVNGTITIAESHLSSIATENQIYTNSLENPSLSIAHKLEKVEPDFVTTAPNYSTATSTTENAKVSENCKTEVDSFDFHPTVTDDHLTEDSTENKKQIIQECNVHVPGKEETSIEIKNKENKEMANACTESSNVSTETKTMDNVQCCTPTVGGESSNVIIKDEQDVCVIEANKLGNFKEVAKLTENIVERANRVINGALDFQLPYMNKAVTEVQKRLNDNILEHKHIDVLQKLIDLEKLHQEHVNTFSKFLE